MYISRFKLHRETEISEGKETYSIFTFGDYQIYWTHSSETNKSIVNKSISFESYLFYFFFFQNYGTIKKKWKHG